MCALHSELIVPIADLDRVAVECGRCKSTTVLELGLRIKDEGGKNILPAVTSCSVCGHDFDTRLKQSLRDLAGLLSFLGGLRDESVSFRLVPPAPTKP